MTAVIPEERLAAASEVRALKAAERGESLRHFPALDAVTAGADRRPDGPSH